MSNLQVTCPKCSLRVIIRRPSANRATVRCRRCGTAFTFQVPAAKESELDPLFTDFAGGGMPGPASQVPASQVPASPRPASRPASNRPVSPRTPISPGAAARRAPSRPPSNWISPVLIGSSLLFVTLFAGVGAWMLLSKTSILPSAVTLFDSPRSILDAAHANDLELQRLVNTLGTTSVPPQTQSEIEELSVDSMRLIARAVLLAPLDEEAARRLSGDGDSGPAADEAPVGPLSETDTEAMRDKLNELPESNRLTIRALVSAGLKSNSLAREYLRFGHLKLPSSGTPAEQIKVKQIELSRELNQLAAKVVMKIDPDFSEKPKTEEEIKQFLDEIYGPIVDDVAELAEKMHQLAATRYQVAGDQVGDPDQFDEIMYYTQKAQASVLVAKLALIRSQAKIVEPLSEFLTASKDVDRASIGLKPKRLAAAEEERQRNEEERIRKEQDRKDRIALQSRQRDQQLRQEKQQADANLDKSAANSSPQGSTGPLADDTRGGDPSPVGPGTRFGPRFGPAGMSDGRFGPGSRIGPRRGPPEGFGNRGNVATNPPRGGPNPPSGQRHSSPPVIEPGTGVTITMDDTSSVDTSKLSMKFSRVLRVSVHSKVSNGKLTLRIAYNGPLDDVIKLIDFGEVISTDEKTRTITLAPK